jgi:hypothetical protein
LVRAVPWLASTRVVKLLRSHWTIFGGGRATRVRLDEFNRLNRGRLPLLFETHGLDQRHDLPPGRRLLGGERRRDRLRLALRAVEDAGQDFMPVLGGHDLGELDDGRDAKAPVAQRLDDLGEFPQELGRSLSIEGQWKRLE